MYSNIASNKRRSALLLSLFVVILVALAWFFAAFFGASKQTTNLIIAGALVYALMNYFFSARATLAMVGGKQIKKADNPELYRIVENLAITEGLPTPKIYIIEDPALNAFATGRNPEHASVAVTSGLLSALNKQELEGVMAHEMGHVKNYDIRVMLMAFAMVATVGLLSDLIIRSTWFMGGDDDNNGVFSLVGIIFALIAPFIAIVIQLAVSRQREFLADSTGALTTRYPEGLASALRKIEANGSVMKRQSATTAHFFFANPIKKGAIAKFFSTHPPIDERIKRLEGMKDSL